MTWAVNENFRTTRKRIGQSIKIFERGEIVLGEALKFLHEPKMRWGERESFRMS